MRFSTATSLVSLLSLASTSFARIHSIVVTSPTVKVNHTLEVTLKTNTFKSANGVENEDDCLIIWGYRLTTSLCPSNNCVGSVVAHDDLFDERRYYTKTGNFTENIPSPPQPGNYILTAAIAYIDGVDVTGGGETTDVGIEFLTTHITAVHAGHRSSGYGQ